MKLRRTKKLSFLDHPVYTLPTVSLEQIHKVLSAHQIKFAAY